MPDDPVRESEWHKATREGRDTASLAHQLTCEYFALYSSPPSLAWLLAQMGLTRSPRAES